MSDTPNFDQIVARLTRTISNLPTMMGTMAVNFSKERFRQQNWLDNTPEPWERRKGEQTGSRRGQRAVLVKSGRLLRSLRKISVSRNRVIVGTDVPYAQAHNDGATINKVANVRTYTKRQYTRTRNGNRETVSSHTVQAHRRNMNLTLPQRRFMGESATLNRKLDELINREINKAITQA